MHMGAVPRVRCGGDVFKHAVGSESEVLGSGVSSVTKWQNVPEQTTLLSWLLFLQKESRSLKLYLLLDKSKSFSGVSEL